MSIIKYHDMLMLILNYGPELEELLKEKKQERLEAECEANAHRLNLCFKHRQEQNHSHFSEHNCDYCKLQNQLLTTNEEETP